MKEQKEENLDLEENLDENEIEVIEKNDVAEEETEENNDTVEDTEEEEDDDDNTVPLRLRNRLYDHIHIPLKTMDRIIYVVVAAIVILIIYGVIKQ